jgi:hypothetical protein
MITRSSATKGCVAPPLWCLAHDQHPLPLLQRQQSGDRVVPLFQQIEPFLLAQPLLLKPYHQSHRLTRRKLGDRMNRREAVPLAQTRRLVHP